MNTYYLEKDSMYRDVTEGIGVPFRVLGPYSNALNPWGVSMVPLGEDLTVADTIGGHTLQRGWLYACVQYRPRHRPVQVGEFYVPDLMVDNYWYEVKRNNE